MRTWLGLALAPLAAAAIIGLPGAAHAEGAAPSAGAAHAEGAWGPITSRWSDKCVDIRREGGDQEGALAQQWDCTNMPELERVLGSERVEVLGLDQLLLAFRSGDGGSVIHFPPP